MLKLLPDELADDIEFAVFINGHGKHGSAVYHLNEWRSHEDYENDIYKEGLGGVTIDTRLGDNEPDEEFPIGDLADFWLEDRGIKWEACEKPSWAKQTEDGDWVKIDG